MHEEKEIFSEKKIFRNSCCELEYFTSRVKLEHRDVLLFPNVCRVCTWTLKFHLWIPLYREVYLLRTTWFYWACGEIRRVFTHEIRGVCALKTLYSPYINITHRFETYKFRMEINYDNDTPRFSIKNSSKFASIESNFRNGSHKRTITIQPILIKIGLKTNWYNNYHTDKMNCTQFKSFSIHIYIYNKQRVCRNFFSQ